MINRKQLHNDIFLSNEQRETMYLDLQADFQRYNDLDTRCAELKDLVHESNPRPYYKTIMRIRDIGSSLSLLRSKVATLRQTIFTGCVRFHKASTFNKDVHKNCQLFLHKLYPKRRKFIDVNSIHMQLIGALMQFHFQAYLD